LNHSFAHIANPVYSLIGVGPFTDHIPQAQDTLNAALPDVSFNGI
jgi:hypothetical protein